MGERVFKDRVVVVTGASRGIGRGCAESFAAEGADVVLVARNRGELDSLATQIRESGGVQITQQTVHERTGRLEIEPLHVE